MVKKLDLTPEEYVIHMKQKGRERAKRNYEKNKELINEKRKEEREYLANLKKKEEERQNEAVVEKEEDTVKIFVKTLIKDGKPVNIVKRVPLYTLKRSLAEAETLKLEKQYASPIRTIFRLTGCDNLAGCLKNFDKIKLDIENGKQKNDKSYKLNSQKQFFQTILVIIDKFKGLKEQIPPETKQKYVNLLNTDILKSKEQTKITNESKTIPSWNKYLTKVIDVFGIKSKEFLISSIYKCVPVRDDLNLKIKNNKRGLDEKQNYLITPKEGDYFVIINTYKTEDKYGQGHKYDLNPDVTNLVKTYIEANKLVVDDFLFAEKKLSLFVSTMNKKLGIKSIEKAIGIKVFRQMTASEGIPEDSTPEQRVNLASKMLHSVESQAVYRRTIEPETD